MIPKVTPVSDQIMRQFDVVPDIDPREQIARLETEIEALRESAEWCRKIAVAAKIAIAAGLALFAAIFVGPVQATGLSLMIAAILSLGGAVLAGSNGTTAQQTAEKIITAEQMRAELIGEMNLTLVPEPSRLLH
jgi:hypothetical protein